MTRVFTKDQIKEVTKPEEVIEAIEEGFRLLAEGKVVIAPLSSLEIDDKGLAKIKYGYVKGQENYVLKVGAFFPNNKEKHLPTVTASMQIYNQQTGTFEALLLDEAYLTNVRTAAAGAVVAKYFAPKDVKMIGVVGTGVQARVQMEYLQQVISCKNVMVWGRNEQEVSAYKKDMEEQGFHIEVAKTVKEIGDNCSVIIATTSAIEPILYADDIQRGTLVISVGSDTKTKQEIDPLLLEKADVVIADSLEQCKELGNIAHALQNGSITEDKIVELGNCIRDRVTRNSEEQIIVANLTGVAVQDIQVANLVYKKLLEEKN